MGCEQIRSLILTDYLDGCCEPLRLAELERHLIVCCGCREFAAMARGQVIAPFTDAPRAHLPEAVWGDIRQKIENKNVFRFPVVVKNFWVWCRPLLTAPSLRPAWMFLFFACVFSSGLLVSRQMTAANEKPEQQPFFLAELTTDNPGDAGYGTFIEKYFL